MRISRLVICRRFMSALLLVLGVAAAAWAQPAKLDIRLSTLEKITPMQASFVTGCEFASSDLDPRTFCPPDTLAALLEVWSRENPGAIGKIELGPPEGEYRVLGIVEVSVRLKTREKAEMPVAELAPNGVAMSVPNSYNWNTDIDRFVRAAQKLKAQGVIEVVCGKSLDVSPVLAPGEMPKASKDWKLYGLAVGRPGE